MSPGSLLGAPGRLARRAGEEAYFLAVCGRAGLFGIEPPGRAVAMLRAFRHFGPLGASVAIAALRHGERTGLVDERGALTFAELDGRSNALANAWRERGLRPGDGVAILARNHRGFVDATFAAAKCGVRAIYLNTDFAGPQIREVAEREGTTLLVHDDEYSAFIDGVDPPLGRMRAWTEEPADDTLEAAIEAGDRRGPPAPGEEASVVVLTSGTTGTPKGAPRAQPRSLAPLGAILSKVPFRGGDPWIVSAPLFHSLGFATAMLAVGLGAPLLLRRRFDPAAVLDDVESRRADTLIVVPVMLARILAALEADPDRNRDLSSLRLIFVGGSQLGGELCERTMEAFGPILYNLYGSTEVSYATIATPDDLRAEPACVGRPPRGAVVRILDDRGRPLPTGSSGRIFVGNPMAFEGYTGGGSKEVVDGLMSTGDVGHLDRAGRLFVDGRDDEMIVSGAENVFPREIEELLVRHEAIEDVAAIGVPDEDFGQRLRAFVVVSPGATVSIDEVKSFVRDNLARYKVPRDVVFVDELPRNPSGKVLKRQLAEREV